MWIATDGRANIGEVAIIWLEVMSRLTCGNHRTEIPWSELLDEAVLYSFGIVTVWTGDTLLSANTQQGRGLTLALSVVILLYGCFHDKNQSGS